MIANDLLYNIELKKEDSNHFRLECCSYMYKNKDSYLKHNISVMLTVTSTDPFKTEIERGTMVRSEKITNLGKRSLAARVLEGFYPRLKKQADEKIESILEKEKVDTDEKER